jgi:possible DNA primase
MNAAYKVFSSIPSIHSQSYVVVLPDGMDPCDYRMKYGSEALRDYVTSKSNQVPIVEHVLNIIAQEYDLEDPAASVRYVERAAPVLKTIASFALREQMIKKVSLDAFMSTSVVRSSVDKADPLTEDDVNEGSVSFVDDSAHKSETESTDSSSNSQPDTDVSSEETQRALVRLIKSDLLYQATARAFLLACRGLPVPSKNDESTDVDKSTQVDNRRDTFIRGHRGYPKEFRYLWEDFKKVSRKEVILPEDFRQKRVVEFIERSLVSKIAVLETTGQQEEGSEASTSQADDLFNYLMGYIYEKKKRQEMDRFVGETTRAVANPDTPVEMVEKAIERIDRKRENLGL